MNVDLANSARVARMVPLAALVALGLPVALRIALRFEAGCRSGTMICVLTYQEFVMLGLTIALGALAGLAGQGKPGLIGVGIGSVIGAWAIWTSRLESDAPAEILLIAGVVLVPLAIGYGLGGLLVRLADRPPGDGDRDLKIMT